MASIAALMSLGGPAGWRAGLEGPTKFAEASYKPKAELDVTVTSDQTTSFLETVEDIAAKSRFELKHNLSGLPLKDGRCVVFLMFARPDGVEIRVANPFHQEDITVDFYDKQETGAWKSVYDKFSNVIGGRFPARQTVIE
jgi:hypothetical protein